MMATFEKIQHLHMQTIQLDVDVGHILDETDDLATRLWINKAVAKLREVERTLHNAQVAAEKSEGLP